MKSVRYWNTFWNYNSKNFETWAEKNHTLEWKFFQEKGSELFEMLSSERGKWLDK